MPLHRNSKNPSFNDFKLLYPKDKLNRNIFKIWRWLFIGRLSLYISWLSVRLNLSANLVTFLSFIFGLMSLYFFSPSVNHNIFYGALCLNFSYLLDCSDGHIARFNKTSSSLGKFLDDSLGELIYIPFWIFIGFGLINFPDQFVNYLILKLNFDISNYIIVISIVTTLTYVIRTVISVRFSECFLEVDEKNLLKSNIDTSIFKIIYKNLLIIGGGLGPLLIIFSYFQITSALVIFYSILYSFNLIYSYNVFLNKLRKQL